MMTLDGLAQDDGRACRVGAVAGQRVSGLQKATGTTGLAELTTTPQVASSRLGSLGGLGIT